MAGILEGSGAAFDAWSCQWNHDGLHADRQHVRNIGVPHEQQDKALRYHHSGEHKLVDVELWCGTFARDAGNHRHYKPAAG